MLESLTKAIQAIGGGEGLSGVSNALFGNKTLGQGLKDFARDTFIPSELQDLFGGESQQGSGFNFQGSQSAQGSSDFNFGTSPGFAAEDLPTGINQPQATQPTVQMDMQQASITNPMSGGLPFFSDMSGGGQPSTPQAAQPQPQAGSSLPLSMPQQEVDRPLGQRVARPENPMLQELNRPQPGATKVLPGQRAMQVGNRQFRFDEPLPEFRLDLPENQ